MKMYGGRSLKPTWLYSNYEWVTGIDRYATQTKAEALRTPNLELVKKYVDGSGRVRIERPLPCCIMNMNQSCGRPGLPTDTRWTP